MQWLEPVRRFFLTLWRLMRGLPHFGTFSLLVGVLIIWVCQAAGFHERFMPWAPANGVEVLAAKGWQPPTTSMLALNYLLPYLKLWMLVGGVVLHIAILRSGGNLSRLVVPIWIACGFLAVWGICTEFADRLQYAESSQMGEPPSFIAYGGKILMILVATLSPGAALSYYTRLKTMDRYTLRTFLQPLAFCFVAFCTLWIVMDLLDSLKDFQEAKIPKLKILLFYINLVPFIFVSVAPASILLAVLYALTKMSRANEVVSMLGAGRSIGQILKPVFVVAVFASVISMAANYYWAPRAEGNKEAIMRALSDEQKEGSILAESLLYRNDAAHRLWFISIFPFNMQDKMRGIEVRELDEKGRPQRAWIAATAVWWPNGVWTFYRGMEVIYQDGAPVEIQHFNGTTSPETRRDVTGWDETPWSIASSSLVPDFMSVPELVAYLNAHASIGEKKLAPFRTHLHHRFALPWQCLVLALVAAPLGIAYSRRGVLGGIAGSIFIFFSLMFVNNLFMSLGKGQHIPAWLAAWGPHFIFTAIGLVLFYFRSQNRDLPKISLDWLIRWFKKPAAPQRLRPAATTV